MEALNLSEKQVAFLAEHGILFDYARMSDDDLIVLEERVADVLELEGLDESYDDNEVGRRAREILDLLARV